MRKPDRESHPMTTPTPLAPRRSPSPIHGQTGQPARLVGRDARRNQLRFEWLEDRTLLATFVVSGTNDAGPGSLRQAILDSDSAAGQANTIDFKIPGSGVQTITPLSALPAITNPVLIDGWSQPGFTGTPLIQLSGSQAGGGDGLLITGSGVTIRGLDINGFAQGAGIHVTGTGATGDWIYGNFLGIDPTGTQALPNNEGVEIDAGATRNLVGTNGDGVNDASERNLISGNLFAGVWITGQGTSSNAVAGDWIGTDITGEVALNNGTQPVTDPLGNVFGGGVAISAGASGNRIGTDGKSIDDAGKRNVIGGSGHDGIDIFGTGTDDNVVAGNFIGADVTGTVSLGIANDGVFLAEGASSNWIGVNPFGGTAARDEGNVIPGNSNDGVQLVSGSDGNTIAGNKIGTDVSGTVRLYNPYYGYWNYGVEVDSTCVRNTIGGLASGAGNVISGNVTGIGMSGTANLIEGNKIGTDVTGTVALGNTSSGIQIDGGASNNTIGGAAAGAGNVISANGGFGIEITGAGTTGNLVQGNKIGTDITGTVALGNAQSGVQIDSGAANNTVGGTIPADRNVISANLNYGLVITGAGTTGNLLRGNLIGTDITGTIALGNVQGGGQADGAGNNTVGGLTTSDGVFHGIDFGSEPVALTLRGDLSGPPKQQTRGGPTAVYRIDMESGAVLLAIVHAQGLTARLMILDSQGRVLVQSDGLSPGDPDSVVDQYLGAGNYSLVVESTGGAGSYALTTMLTLASAPLQPLPVGVFPSAIVAGDFTGDGHTDLAVANEVDNTVSVLLGNGDGTFQPQVTYAVGAEPDAIVAGDFTGDGHTDLAVANNLDNTVSVLLGNGDGTFQPAKTVAAGVSGSLAAGDFTGDDRTDLAVANGSDNTVSVLLGNGDGTFQPQVTYAVGAQPGAIVAGDFTGNGHIDLAVANGKFYGPGTVSVLLGNGDGTFQTPITYGVGFEPQGIVAGDFRDNGRTDLAVANQSDGTVSVLLGNGDGTFQPQVQPGNAAGPDPTAVVAGDFTGNGRTDLAVADSGSNEVSVLLANGDGTFQPPITYAVGSDPVSIVAGDFNGDGRTDLAVVNSNLSGTGPGSVSVLLGNGDGTFQPQVTYAVGTYPVAIVAGDFTGNGHLDLATANENSNDVSVLLGNGDGTFQPQVTYAVGVYPSAIVAGDFTGDGHLDLAVANGGGGYGSTISVLLGNGDGTFQPQVTYAVGQNPDAIAVGDFTGDGHLDLAVANEYDSTVSVLLGNGDGTFQPQVTYAVQYVWLPDAIVAGDFTGDGRTDLAVANLYGGNVSVLLGNGDGTFQPQVTYAVGVNPDAIVAGDFTGDGRTDLAVANRGDNNVSVLLSNGDGTFSDAGKFVTTPHATPLVADVNGDGTNDVLVVDGAGNILYRQGIPGQPGTFEPPVTVNPGIPSRDIAWVTNPGQVPVLASVDAHDNGITLYSYGDDGFVKVGSLATGPLPAQVIAADLDGNGLTDLVVRNAGDGTLSVFYGTAFNRSTFHPDQPQYVPPEFSLPVTIPVGLGVSDVQAVASTGSGKLDLVVANKLTGQVGIVQNLGGGTFGALELYRAGTGLSAIDPTSSPEVTSLEATAGVAVGSLTPGGPTDLITLNSGSKTLGVLAGLGQGRFANPLGLYTGNPAQVIRMADLTGNCTPDLVLLGTNQVSIMLGDGHGGFQKPVSYDAGLEPTSLTVADINGDRKPDLVIGNTYGDLLILQGNGDGTFRPYREADKAVALAVADLTGNGKPDFIYADQSLDRVVVQYGTRQTKVLGNQATGLLSPGAVKLADLNGDGIPDLIVANSGSNNVLVYPGLGNGQFGPALNGGNGFFVGTNPTGITVANLNGQPDLIVANSGSNDVSILLGQGSGSNWTLVPGARVSTDAGPVAVAVGNIMGNGKQDLVVANQQADNVQVFPGQGGGFFSQNATTYPVGQAPDGLFLGGFSGSGTQIATLNGGSNSISLINPSTGGVTQTIPTGGVLPTSGFAGHFSGNGFSDLVVGNTADGRIALFLGGAGGLSLSQSTTSAEVPSPTALSFAGLSGGVLSFYAATAGREAASLLAFNLNQQEGSDTGAGALTGQTLAGSTGQSPGAVLAAATTGVFQQVSQLLSFSGSAQDLVTTLLTVSVLPGSSAEASGGGTVAAPTAGIQPSTVPGVGQCLGSDRPQAGSGGDQPEQKAEVPEGSQLQAALKELPAWERLASGLERAWKQIRSELLEREVQPEVAGDRQSPVPSAASPALRNRMESTPGDRNEPRVRPKTQARPPAASSLLPAPTGLDPHEPGGTEVIDSAMEAMAAEADAGLYPLRGASAFAATAVALASTLGADWIRRRYARRVGATHQLMN